MLKNINGKNKATIPKIMQPVIKYNGINKLTIPRINATCYTT